MLLGESGQSLPGFWPLMVQGAGGGEGQVPACVESAIIQSRIGGQPTASIPGIQTTGTVTLRLRGIPVVEGASVVCTALAGGGGGMSAGRATPAILCNKRGSVQISSVSCIVIVETEMMQENKVT